MSASLLVLVSFAGCLSGDPEPSDRGVPDPDLPGAEGISAWVYGPEMEARPIHDGVPGIVSQLIGVNGAEPSIGISPDGTIFVQALAKTLRSTDMGASWETILSFGASEGGQGPFESADPILYHDAGAGTLYVGHQWADPRATCMTLLWTEDDGDTWSRNDMACGTPAFDHPKLVVAPPGPDAPTGPHWQYHKALILCYNKFLDTACAASYDGGESFPIEQVAIDRARHGCGGINGAPAAAPNGTVVVPASLDCAHLALAVSTDSGLSWTVRSGPPGPGAESQDPAVAFTSDGGLLALWRGEDDLLYLARSEDLARSWAGPWRVTPPGVNTTVFQTLAVDPDGEIWLSFLGTDAQGPPAEVDDHADWRLFAVHAGGLQTTPRFQAVEVTPPDDPVHVGCAFGGSGAPPRTCRVMLDFITSDFSPDGSYVVAYTDACTGACAKAERPSHADSNSQEIAIATVTSSPAPTKK